MIFPQPMMITPVSSSVVVEGGFLAAKSKNQLLSYNLLHVHIPIANIQYKIKIAWVSSCGSNQNITKILFKTIIKVKINQFSIFWIFSYIGQSLHPKRWLSYCIASKVMVDIYIYYILYVLTNHISRVRIIAFQDWKYS